MIGLSRDFVVELVALILLIGQQGAQAATGANFDQNNLSSEIREQKGPNVGPVEQAHQVQYESNNAIQGNQENLRQYLLKDLDLDGYTLSKPTAEQWRWFQLNKLLEQLSSSIPIPEPPLAPIYRTGRTYPSMGYGASPMGGDFAPAARSIPILRLATPNGGLQSLDKNQRARKQSVRGIDWAGSRPSGSSALVTVRRSQSLNGPAGQLDRAQLQRPIGSEEIAMHTPMHARSASDYEWKRVENLSKWNNLRGMWGKRAVNTGSPLSDSNEASGAPSTGYQTIED